MNSQDVAYTKYGLVRDMLAAPELVAGFQATVSKPLADRLAGVGRLLFTGEGSSRIFPSKQAMMQARVRGDSCALHSEAGLQAGSYDLRQWAVLAVSNSGKTSEVVKLLQQLQQAGHPHCYSLTAQANSKLESLAHQGFVLTCGPEGAVAATKSVIEQALFCQSLLEHLANRVTSAATWQAVGAAMQTALTLPIAPVLVQRVAQAGTIYFAGPNDGVAEELTLKTNEITRKSADYLEGTYAVHGIEEVMNPQDVVIWVAPPADSEEKFQTVLEQGVGLQIIAISDRPTRFPTLQVPASDMPGYVHMAAGWNLLVEVGIALGVDLDKPVRARKVGNEFQG